MMLCYGVASGRVLCTEAVTFHLEDLLISRIFDSKDNKSKQDNLKQFLISWDANVFLSLTLGDVRKKPLTKHLFCYVCIWMGTRVCLSTIDLIATRSMLGLVMTWSVRILLECFLVCHGLIFVMQVCMCGT